MKYYYFVVGVEEKTGLKWARVEKLTENHNIKCLFDYENIKSLNICNTKKQAETTADAWNAAYKEKGIRAF